MTRSIIAAIGVLAALGQTAIAAPPSASAWYTSTPAYSKQPSTTSTTLSSISSQGSSTASNDTWYNGHTAPRDCSAQLNGKLPDQIPTDFKYSGNVRSYYIQAEMVEWNYVPSGWDNWLGVPIAASTRAKKDGVLGSIGGNNGTTWLQALYRGYTDASFSTLSPQQKTAGSQGPLIRAEVGDLIQVYFRNALPEHYASIHSMGLTYDKENEGSLYANTTDGSSPSYGVQEAVPPQGCTVYKWIVTNESAPRGNAPSKAWSYHSFVNMYSDTNAGLMGPVIVYAPGAMNSTMASYREFTLLYNVYDQTQNFLAAANEQKYGNGSQTPTEVQLAEQYSGNYSIWKPQLVNMPTVELSSSQAPKLHGLNGYMYSNGEPFEMCQDDQAIWYVYAFGSASHVFHMHGNNFQISDGSYHASQNLNDGEMHTLFMRASLPGVWQVLCHVNNHLSGGMERDYQIFPSHGCPLPALTPLNGNTTSSTN